MSKLFLFFFLSPMIAWAHCPFGLKYDGKDYCLDLEWLPAESQITTTALSPHLNPMGEIPQKWVYSQFETFVWEKGDKKHTPVLIPDFRIFPYMFMDSGHHHGASYEFQTDDSNSSYLLKRVAFQEMPGCWTLRWTTHSSDSLEDSQPLAKITDFVNLSEEGVSAQVDSCSNVDENPSGGGHQHHH